VGEEDNGRNQQSCPVAAPSREDATLSGRGQARWFPVGAASRQQVMFGESGKRSKGRA